MLTQMCLLFQYLLIRKNAYVWGVSGWCLWVSDGVWIISWGCLADVRCHINHKQLNRSRHINLVSFLPETSHSQKIVNFWVSVGCLEGVWKVSGRCLEGVWVTLDTVWGVIMPNQLINFQWASF